MSCPAANRVLGVGQFWRAQTDQFWSAPKLGNGLFESSTYNDRNQPLSMQLGVSSGSGGIWQQDYDLGTSSTNNANVRKLTLKIPGKPDVVTQYEYDALNWLKVAMEGAAVVGNGCVAGNTVWCQGFNYDVAGNVLVGSEYGVAAPLGRPSSYAAASNRVSNSGWVYDGRGNVSQIPDVAATPDKMLFDGEDRMAQYCGNSLAACDTVVPGGNRTIYRYDVLGKRVRKEGVGGDLTFVHDAFGELAAEYGGTESWKRSYVTVDHLGSTRVVTEANGSVGERRDYLGFGGEVGSSVGSRSGVAGYGVDLASRVKCSSKERDAESGLDYFGARYYSGAMGRFTSADAPFADQHPGDPQRWNLYSYVRNNPLRYVDDDGHGAKEFWLGMTNAFSANHTYGYGRLNASHPDERMGQKAGDALSVILGGVEVAFGGGVAARGVAVCATG